MVAGASVRTQPPYPNHFLSHPTVAAMDANQAAQLITSMQSLLNKADNVDQNMTALNNKMDKLTSDTTPAIAQVRSDVTQELTAVKVTMKNLESVVDAHDQAMAKANEVHQEERKDMEKDVATFFANNAEAFRQAGVSMDEAITMGLTRAKEAASSFLAAQERRDIRGQEALLATREAPKKKTKADLESLFIQYTLKIPENTMTVAEIQREARNLGLDPLKPSLAGAIEAVNTVFWRALGF